MSIYDQIGSPGVDVILEGKNTLNRIVRVEASVGAPVQPTNLHGIINLEIDNGSSDEIEVFQQGAGDERTTYRSNYKWSGTITVHKGKLPYVLAQLLGISWEISEQPLLPFKLINNFPKVHWEAVFRKKDNSTHAFTVIIPEMIIDPVAISNALENSEQTIPFHTYFPPCFLKANAELVYDQFMADGSTTEFTASSTPLNLLDASNYEDFFLNYAILIKEKASGDSTGTKKMSGYSYSSGKFIASTAPASGTIVQILYAKSVS